MRLTKLTLLITTTILLSSTLMAQPKYWTWSHYSSERNWVEYLTQLKDTGITGLLLNASKEGYEKVIPLADSLGIEVHAWIWIMNNGTIAAEHPEWLDYNRNGESLKDKKAYVDYYKFLNPIIPGVQNAIVRYIDDIAQIKGLKGISLDYCRYVDAILPTSLWANYGIKQDKVYAEWDYGYHPDMIAAFQKKYGYDPREQQDVNSDQKWHQFRMDKVNEVVDKLAKVARKRSIEITASPFPTPEMSRRMVYQDWGQWKLDRAFPMIYNGFYYGDLPWIASCVADCRRDMQSRTKLYIGLYVPDFGKDSKFTIIQAMQTAMDSGAEGVAFFTFDSFSAEQKAEIKEFIKNH